MNIESNRTFERAGAQPEAHPARLSRRTEAGRSLMFGEGKWRFINLVWLIYSVFFFIEPLQHDRLNEWLILAAVYPSFIALYLGILYSRSRRLQAQLLAALAALGIAYYPFNGAAGMISIYVAAIAPFLTESVALAAGIIVAAIVVTTAEGILIHQSPWNWAMFVFFCVPAGASNLFVAMRARANRQLELAHDQIEHLAKVAERERIARDLHDVLGHTLSLIVLKSELAGRVLPHDPERALREIGDVEQTARTALTEVREAIRGYRPEGLDVELARARQTLALVGVELEGGTELPRIDPATEGVLTLVLRESVTNIVRHARATHCRFALSSDALRTLLVVQDDGRGGIDREGNGLRGMRERIGSLGGQLSIESGEGTRLTVEIPAPQSAQAAPA